MNEQRIVVAPGFKHQHAFGAIRAEPVAQDSSGGTRASYDVVPRFSF
jgi:hypothetical protein